MMVATLCKCGLTPQVVNDPAAMATRVRCRCGRSGPFMETSESAIMEWNGDMLPSPVLTFEQLRKANTPRCEAVFHPLNDWSPFEWAACMVGEAGEATNQAKKLRRIHRELDQALRKDHKMASHFANTTAIEAADTVIYADLLCSRLNFQLGDIVRWKFNKVSDENNCAIKL